MLRLRVCIVVLTLVLVSGPIVAQDDGVVAKTRSVLYPAELVQRARANAAAYPWAADMQRQLVDRAEPWLGLSDDDLWGLMFGPNITRSWMVWSDGFCPACKQDVKMYKWEIDPWTLPWKVRCPNCKEVFPKNDFEAFHRSGLDERGIFQPDRANRSLLFNVDHPDPDDPLHRFGADDGEGYVDDEGHRWRFIGAYLIYGQWKRWIHAGIVHLSEAYVATGDARYAHKAAILLDRVADVFPTFNHETQALVYETGGHRGQISTWHDACEEVRELALAYDRIFEAARADEDALVAFLCAKAQEYGIDNPKQSWADIQRNIEERIFRDTLTHETRIRSNYPRTPIAVFVIKTVLDWPHNRPEVLTLLDEVIAQATAVDGVSGEKGMAGYTTIAPRALSEILAQCGRLDPNFLKTVYERHPVLHQTFRFHIDMWCMEQYYPRAGDTGAFGQKESAYGGVTFSTNPGADPSMYTFMWDLSELTDDPDFVRVLYRGNGMTVDGLPHDLFAGDPAAFQAQVQAVIDDVGPDSRQTSVNKEQWRLAILRSGQGLDRRALWIDYDAGGGHGHADGMNVGLFAKGFDLIPDFGYPPVGYGGWGAPKARWYTRSAAHHTVVVDGKDHKSVNTGLTTLWADGDRFRAVRAADPALIGGEQFERTLALIDLDERDSYVVDCFRVVGGKDHAKFFHSFFGEIDVEGLEVEPAENYGHNTEMRNFRCDPSPELGWSVDWTIDDRYDYAPEGVEVHLRYTDLTWDAQAYLAEGWIDPKLFGEGNPEWIPRIMVRRTGDRAPLDSVFVSVIEPYANRAKLRAIRRLLLYAGDGAVLPASSVGIEIKRRDGRRDVFLLTDSAYGDEVVEPENDIRFRGDLAHVTLGPEGIERAALCRAQMLRVGDAVLKVKPAAADFVEVMFEPAGVRVVAGDPCAVAF